MNFKTFAPVLALGLAASAQAVSLPNALPSNPISLPGASIGAVVTVPALGLTSAVPALASVSMPLSAPMSLPAPLPANIAPARLPGVPSPLPLPARAIVAHRRPAASVGETFVLNWTLLDGDGTEPASALVPVTPGPTPLSPAGALAELRDAAAGREPIRVEAVKVFDGRRESLREIALPHDKFF